MCSVNDISNTVFVVVVQTDGEGKVSSDLKRLQFLIIIVQLLYIMLLCIIIMLVDLC